MAKKKGSDRASGQYASMSIREELRGRKQNNNLKSIMKIQHLQNLAVWAAGKASIPSLGALFGRQFAATGEALGIPPDPSLFPCQRCETILQPGFNCTVRVVKCKGKKRRQGKKTISTAQNNVVYRCHFCSYENLKRGTSKEHMREICPPKPKPAPSAHKNQVATSEQGTINKLETTKTGEDISLVADNPPTPSASKGLTLLDSKKRKRSKGKPKKPDEAEANSAMTDAKSKRKKGWTTLREIAESNARENTRTFTNFSIPFTLS